MSEAIKSTINELQNQIRVWEQEIADTKKVINSLAVRASMQPVYSDVDLLPKSSAMAMRRDQFYGKTLASALREYLQMRQAANLGPATVNELLDALTEGGFDHGSANDDNAKRVIRITLTKNSGLFHRLPDDKHFGLIEWYPAVKSRKQKDSDSDEAAPAISKESEPGAGGASSPSVAAGEPNLVPLIETVSIAIPKPSKAANAAKEAVSHE